MNVFSIDFRKLVLMLLPSQLRQPTLYHLSYLLVIPIVTIYRSFFARRKNNLFYARYDSGKGNIERMLNIYFFDEFDVDGGNDIYINNTFPDDASYGKIFIGDVTDTSSAFVGDSYIDYEISQKLFDVYVPSSIYDDDKKKTEVEKMVGNYLLPGIGFNVKEDE